MHEVAPHQQLLAGAAIDLVRHMADRMTMAVQRGDARRQCVARCKALQFPARFIRRHRLARQGEGKAHALRRGCLAGRIQPERGIGRRQPHRGIRVGHRVLRIEQATQMIRVRVGQHDIIHLGRVVAGLAQVAQHLAQAGAEALRGAGVDQGQVIALLHQVGIDRGLQALAILGYVAVIKQAGDRAGGDPDQLLPTQRDSAIEQRGDLQRADGLVIHAGDLLARGVRGGGQCGAGDNGQQHGGGERANAGEGHDRFRTGRQRRGASMLRVLFAAFRSECRAIRSRSAVADRRRFQPVTFGEALVEAAQRAVAHARGHGLQRQPGGVEQAHRMREPRIGDQLAHAGLLAGQAPPQGRTAEPELRFEIA